MKTIVLAIVIIGGVVAGSTDACAREGFTQTQDLKLPPDLMSLLRAEMREVAGGVQVLTLSLATADWKSIQDTSAKIRASYIMEKKLTAAQAGELEKALPEQFKQLDAEFHGRAASLGAAAAAHDLELVVFYYSRLLEDCARCHSAYARQRFPGFVSPTPPDHRR